MSKLVRYTADELRSDEVGVELRRLAEMLDSEIRTDLIPERRFNIALPIERRRAGRISNRLVQKKAS